MTAQSGALAFVINPHSGGQDGRRVLQMLRKSQPEERIFILQEVDLAQVVRSLSGIRAIIACGGDGTVTSVLEAVYRERKHIPIGVIPLGTGNDLARAFGWPGVCAGERQVGDLLCRLEGARPRALDRWILEGPGGNQAWYNYCSWGYDARVAGRFHELRRQHQSLFRWRLANMACYAGIGMQEPGSDLSTCLTADLPRPIPAWTRSLILVGITTYAGGRRLADDIVVDDGQCDCFALPSGLAFGLRLSGLRKPYRLGRHRTIQLKLKRPLFVQMDGESHLAQPGQYRIRHGGQVEVLGKA
jgi:diacylglycerol kinase (ATP)